MLVLTPLASPNGTPSLSVVSLRVHVVAHVAKFVRKKAHEQSVVMAVDVAEAVNVVDTADVRWRHGAEGPRWLQIVAVVQSRRRRTGPVREARRSNAGSHQVQFGDPRERDG